MTRVWRSASWGIDPLPNSRPSSVMALASGDRPATENDAAVLSVAPMGTTPGASVASAARSVTSRGSRASCSTLMFRSVEPGVGGSKPAGSRRLPRTVIWSSRTGVPAIDTFHTSRSSSAWRISMACRGTMPTTRAVMRYWPPPSGNRIV